MGRHPKFDAFGNFRPEISQAALKAFPGLLLLFFRAIKAHIDLGIAEFICDFNARNGNKFYTRVLDAAAYCSIPV